ncbi:MAG: ATP-binding protein, partial [Bacillus sp. (in: firmicutes)]
RINIDNIAIQKNMTFLSDTCDQHRYFKDGEERIKKVQLMNIGGEIVCPLCESEKREKQLEHEVYEIHKDRIEHPNKFIFFNESMVSDDTILKARFSNFKPECEEERNNLILARTALEDHMEGKTFTLWLQGKPGAGKSHLAYSLAHAFNETGNHKVLFIDMSELMKTIRGTFSKQSEETEQSIVKKIINADLVVLDDIGTEVGNIDTETTASDFVTRVVKDIFNGRQGKTTLVTSNLTGGQIKKIYDAKTVSRMFSNYRYIKFEKSKDKRMIELPF